MPNYALILRAPCEGGVPVRLFKVCVSSTNTTPPTSKPGPERGAYSIITPASPYLSPGGALGYTLYSCYEVALHQLILGA